MDIQWRLNKAGTIPQLTVDGIAGTNTRKALEAFQTKLGTTTWPDTWVALEKIS
jgi:peptidoglycan hydrolase-like protein with peptidoglycan-binding domain